MTTAAILLAFSGAVLLVMGEFTDGLQWIVIAGLIIVTDRATP